LINPDGGTRTWDYNYLHAHHIRTFTDENGKWGRDDYDDYGRVNQARQRDGNLVNINIAFSSLKVFEPNQNTSTISLSGIPLTPAVAFTPNEFVAEQRNALNQTQTFNLNKTGQVTKATDALGGTSQIAWTPDGLPTKTTDKYGNITSYKYDNKGNVTEIIYGNVDTASDTTRIFGDSSISVPLDPTNTTYKVISHCNKVG
jgi:YD repeat-containing protein